MHQFFSSDFFNFEFLRILSTTSSGGCEIGEALEACTNITDGDPESWSREFLAIAGRAEAFAEEAVETGDVVAARNAFLRASNYYRASQFMLQNRPEARDPRVLQRFNKCVSLFRKGVVLHSDFDVVFLSLPWDDIISMPAYLYLPKPTHRLDDGKIPLVVNVNGGDSVQEELFFICPSAGPRLGYAVLTFDGPGQGATLRQNDLHMRPDYEVATSRVLDTFEKEGYYSTYGLDKDRISLVGASLGAYFALRSASDSRFKACVSIDPPYDLWELIASKMPGWFLNGWANGWISDSWVNRVIVWHSALDFRLKWETNHLMWAFGMSTPAEALKNLKSYSLGPDRDGKDWKGYLSRVHCSVMVTGAAASIYFRPELGCQRIYDELTDLFNTKKTIWIGKDVIDGGLQAKIAAFHRSNQKTFSFLDQVFGITRERS